MNKLFLISTIFLCCGFTAIHDKHKDLSEVDDEINNISIQTQNIQHTVFATTPTLNDLEDHQMVLVSSNGWSAIMYRDNIEIYAIKASCVTVIR